MSPVQSVESTTAGGGTAEWRTPPELFARLERRFGFDYDAFASHENALCCYYSTIDGTWERPQEWRDPMRDSHEDGLAFPWENWRVFMNPPFSRGFIEKAVEKAYSERENAAIIVALLPAATETRWFQQIVLPYCHIDWLPRRVRFVHPDERCSEDCTHALGQAGPSPTTGHVIATFKAELL